MSSKNKSSKSDQQPKPSSSPKKAALGEEELSEEQLDDVTGGADVTGDRFKNCCIGDVADQQLSLDVETSLLGASLTVDK